MNDLAESYKDINKKLNTIREYKVIMYDIALPFRDFYVKFIRLDRELTYIENTLLIDLLNKLYSRLRVLAVNYDKFTTITSIKNYLINLNN